MSFVKVLFNLSTETSNFTPIQLFGFEYWNHVKVFYNILFPTFQTTALKEKF